MLPKHYDFDYSPKNLVAHLKNILFVFTETFSQFVSDQVQPIVSAEDNLWVRLEQGRQISTTEYLILLSSFLNLHSPLRDRVAVHFILRQDMKRSSDPYQKRK